MKYRAVIGFASSLHGDVFTDVGEVVARHFDSATAKPLTRVAYLNMVGKNTAEDGLDDALQAAVNIDYYSILELESVAEAL